MDLEPKKLMFCLMTAVSENEELADDLLQLHDLLENAGKMKGNFTLLKDEIGRIMTDFGDFASGKGFSDEFVNNTDKLVQCFAAYMWILRIHAGVDRYAPLLQVMDGITEFNDMINKTNEFQESNT